MLPHMINVMVSGFSGLQLPRTLNLVCRDDVSISDLLVRIRKNLPVINYRLAFTTFSNHELTDSHAPISSLYHGKDIHLLQIRISVPLCGGKGGFGSQLRAAGGRMSSKKKRNGETSESNSSNRNLDGRRIRTVNEAKALAEYLAVKPEMQKKEKEAQRRRWQEIIELSERREDDMRTGSKVRLDTRWVEEKEEISERTREIVTTVLGLTEANGMSMSSAEETAKVGTACDIEKLPVLSTSETSRQETDRERKKIRAYEGFDPDIAYMSDSASETNALDTNLPKR